MLSIIIPTLNEEQYLGILLESLVQQYYKDFEVIIVDGSSQDKTISIAQHFIKKMKMTIVSVKKPGASRQRNYGVKYARGKTLLFLDADCILPKEFLKSMMLECTERKIHLGGAKIYPIESNHLIQVYYACFRVYLKTVRLFKPYLNTCCLLIDKEIHTTISGFNEHIIFAEDYEYSCRAATLAPSLQFNTVIIKTSARRFQHHGFLKTSLQYIVAGFLLLFLKGFRKNYLGYSFGKHGKTQR